MPFSGGFQYSEDKQSIEMILFTKWTPNDFILTGQFMTNTFDK